MHQAKCVHVLFRAYFQTMHSAGTMLDTQYTPSFKQSYLQTVWFACIHAYWMEPDFSEKCRMCLQHRFAAWRQQQQHKNNINVLLQMALQYAASNFNMTSKCEAWKLKIGFASGFLMTAAHIGSLPLESVAAYIAPPLVGWVSLAAHLSPTATNCLPLAPSSPCPGATCPAHCAQGVYSLVICIT